MVIVIIFAYSGLDAGVSLSWVAVVGPDSSGLVFSKSDQDMTLTLPKASLTISRG